MERPCRKTKGPAVFEPVVKLSTAERLIDAAIRRVHVSGAPFLSAETARLLEDLKGDLCRTALREAPTNPEMRAESATK